MGRRPKGVPPKVTRHINALITMEAFEVYSQARSGKGGWLISQALVFYGEHGPHMKTGMHWRIDKMERNIMALQRRLTEAMEAMETDE